MIKESISYYEKVKQNEIIWAKNFINNLPDITKDEKEKLLSLSDNIDVNTIGQINIFIEDSQNISNDEKETFLNHLRQIEWFDWQPGERYRYFNGHIYVRMMPAQWLPDELLEQYYNDRPPEERTIYECQRYLNKHPRKAKTITPEEYDTLYQKYLRKFTREWNKTHFSDTSHSSCSKSEYFDSFENFQEVKTSQLKESYDETNCQMSIPFDVENSINESNCTKQEKTKSSKRSCKKLLNTSDSSAVTNNELLPVLNFNRQYMSNTKLNRILATKQIDISDDSFQLKINEQVVNLVDIWSDENITLSSKNITQYDLSVMDAAYTIMVQGPMIITPEWILKVMSGNQNQKPTEAKIKTVKDSIKKLQSVRIKVDCTNEYNAYQIQKGKKGITNKLTYESYLLPLGKIEARYEANGKMVTAYTVLEKPALYRYAEMNHQIIDVPAYLLETQEYFSDTDQAILIKRYVIRRVAQIVKKNNIKTNKISFIWYDKKDGEERGLYPELGYKDNNSEHFRKKTKPMINKIVKGTLETLKQANAITDYEEYRKDGTKNPSSPIIGYKIYYKTKETILPTL